MNLLNLNEKKARVSEDLEGDKDLEGGEVEFL